jgi:hypothetical protein
MPNLPAELSLALQVPSTPERAIDCGSRCSSNAPQPRTLPAIKDNCAPFKKLTHHPTASRTGAAAGCIPE